MSGRVFTQVPKPESATPTRRPNDPVQKRNPLVREPFKARPGQPLPYYAPIPPNRAGVQSQAQTEIQAKPMPDEAEVMPQERPDNATAFAPPTGDRPVPPEAPGLPPPRPPTYQGFNLLQRLLQRQGETEQQQDKEVETEEVPIQTQPLAEQPHPDPRRRADFNFTMIPLYPPGQARPRVEPVRPRQMPPLQAAALENKAKSVLQRQVDAAQSEDETEREEQAPLQAKPIQDHGPIVQRQATENTEEEKEEPIQAKLRVGEPNDKFEREADSVADTVMRLPEPGLQRQEETEQEEDEEAVAEAAPIQTKPIAESITPLIQRQAEEEEEEAVQTKSLIQRQVEEEEEEVVQAKSNTPTISTELEGQLNRTQGSGQPLSESSRQFFEPRFGQDFGEVRIHADGQAADAAKNIQAQAFTHKQDIYFGNGHYQPNTEKGRTLLAHELTHTVQQTGKQPSVNRDVISCRAATASEGITNPAETQVKTPESTTLPQVDSGVFFGRTSNQIGAEPETYSLNSQIKPGNNLGKPLDTSTKEKMSRKIGFDFSNVRIHTDDLAIYLNKGLNARAFTHGSDIYFNKGEYSPNSLGGKKLLAHELTHVVQQSQMTDKTAQREMIQCTSIGQILDNFFSPFSSETLWIMPENDNYTRIVRRWQPVIDAVNRAKANLAANCANWSANHMTDSSWKPGMTDPPVTDPNAHDIWVSSPPGTDPETCRNAFIVYVTTKANPFTPTIQTFELYTCSIGSFGIYATVDSIDCAAKTAQMNIWMYNAMDQDSFGRYASHPLFALSGMERQYMWWNWSEPHSWGSSGRNSGGSGGGSSGW